MNLSKDVSLREVLAPIAAASTIDSNSDRIDMSGFEGVLFVAPITDSVATGVAKLQVEQNDDDSDAGMKALSGASATATCVVGDDLNGKLLVVDVYRPAKRYVQGVLTSTTANIAFGSMIAIPYGPRSKPVAAHASIAAAALAVSPAEAS